MEELELEELYNFVKDADHLKFTLKEIVKCWQESYGEDLVEEYSGFIQKLIENESN